MVVEYHYLCAETEIYWICSEEEVHGLFMYPPQTQHADFITLAAAAAASPRRWNMFLAENVFHTQKNKKKEEKNSVVVVVQREESQGDKWANRKANSPARPEHR